MGKKFFKAIFTVFFIMSITVLNARTDSLSLSMQGLSIHPENQRDFAAYYDRKLDSHGDFVLTPGFMISYDLNIPDDRSDYIRITAGYISDCAKLPAGFIGSGILIPMIRQDYYSVYGCFGAGLFARRDWRSRINNYYSPVLQHSGSVEWMIMPYPEIELRLHPWDSRLSVIVSFFSVIYVSQLSAGVQIKI